MSAPEKHTPGPFMVVPHGDWTGMEGVSLGIDDALGQDGERDYHLATVVHGDPDELKANAALFSAAPDLLAIATAFAITGPDGDGLVWFQYLGGGKMGAINLGHRVSIVGQAALAFEAKRRAAVAKARGEA